MAQRSGAQKAALRACLLHDLTAAQALHDALVNGDDLDGYGELVTATFMIMARRRFGPDWDRSEVIRFVAKSRSRVSGREDDIDPLVAEALIMHVLGEPLRTAAGEPERSRTGLLVLDEMVQEARLRPTEVDAVLEEALNQVNEHQRDTREK